MMVLLVMLIWNIIVFSLYGIDKYKAVRGYWRISEKALVVCAFMMGAPGAALGMKMFCHKTRKLLFKICVPIALVLNIMIFILLERM